MMVEPVDQLPRTRELGKGSDNFKSKLSESMFQVVRLRLFGKKKAPEPEETAYEIFGGFTITKSSGGYEIKWKSPNITTITVHSPPVIAENVQTTSVGDVVQVLSIDCKLRITAKDGKTGAHVSRI